MSLRRCIGVLAVVLAAVAATASSAVASSSCARTYSYAGYDSPWYAHGVVSTITVLEDPLVSAGHVAAWVGVGGVGAALDGSDEWLQVGVAGFEPENGAGNELYWEIALPHRDPVYHKIGAITTLVPVRLAVLEMAHRWGWWRIWMNGKPATAPIFLPASHGVWQPEVTTESWNGGTGSCNHYSYKFDRVAIARAAGGGWMRLRRGHRYADPGYAVQGHSPRRFLASSSG